VDPTEPAQEPHHEPQQPAKPGPVTVRGVTLPETVEAPIAPLDVTGVRTVTTGTTLFVLATVVLLVNLDWLRDHDRMWWLWTCLVGIGLGVFGYVYCTRRARHVAAAAQQPSRHRRHTLD
jgi:hypothetical protein